METPSTIRSSTRDLRFALDYWRQKRGIRLAPTRGDIDPVDIAPVLPQVMLVDVGSDPVDFRFRLAGTGLFKIHGAELTNKRALDLEPPAYGALIHRLYCDALARRAPIVHRLLIECETRRSAYMRIVPLSEDGQAINRLMTVESYADAAQDLRDCFEEARLQRQRLLKPGPDCLSEEKTQSSVRPMSSAAPRRRGRCSSAWVRSSRALAA